MLRADRLLTGQGFDDEPPRGVKDGSLFVFVPLKSELDLGRSLALRFVEKLLPDKRDTAYDYFRARGAYSRFKSLLELVGQLDAW
jgi:hypothetical protein